MQKNRIIDFSPVIGFILNRFRIVILTEKIRHLMPRFVNLIHIFYTF